MIKVLYVIDDLKYGGAERQLVELIKGVQGKEVHPVLCCLNKSPRGFTCEVERVGIPICYAHRLFRWDISPIFQILKLIRTYDIDIVHSWLVLGALFGSIAAKLAGTPSICSGIRDAKDQNNRQKLYKHIEARLADFFVSNSKIGLTNRFGKMQPKFRIIYNGITPIEAYSQNNKRNRVFKHDGIDPNQYYPLIGMVASFTDHKDHISVLKSIPNLLDRFPNILFIFVGDGPNKDSVIQTAVDMGVIKHTLFAGFCSDVYTWFRIMDLSILISNTKKHLEGISNSLLESMSSGVPVIATAGGGTEELIQNKHNGLLIPPSDPDSLAKAIELLIANRNYRLQLASNAKSDSNNKFSMEKYIHSYLNLYHEAYCLAR